MDVQMPTMDGYEATRCIRAQELTADKRRVPIVALTAHVMEAEVQRCLTAGCDGHLGKPITRAALVNSIVTFARGLPTRGVERETSVKGASAAHPPSEIAHLAPRYLEACRARIAELKQAADSGDFAVLARHAHDLRGSGGAFGFPAITQHASRMEQAARAQDSPALAREIAELQHYLDS
jgi:CheY-like chemotaxis protein